MRWRLFFRFVVIICLLQTLNIPITDLQRPRVVHADCVPGKNVNMTTFATDVLNIMGISVSQFAIDAFAKWEPYENTDACWNPLATTYQVAWFPAGTGCTETIFNSAGVRNYSSQYCGELATARTLLYTSNGTYYKAIRDMLAQISFNWQSIHDAVKGWVGSEAYATSLTNEWQTLWNSGSDPQAPANTNLVRNGNFSSDFDYWSKTANTAWAIYGGVLAWKAEPTGTYGSIEQTLNYSFSTNSVVEMTFTLGNSSSVQKHVRPHLHQVGSWDDMLVCDFYLEPNAPMRTFIMRRRLTQNWANASVYLEVYPPDGIPDVLTDDVSVQYRPSLSVSGSECLSVPNHPVILFRNANQLGDWCSLDQTGWKNTSTCTGFDDKASSIQIRSGWSARVWSDANRTGESRCLSGGTANFTGLQYTENGSSNLNDSISSFEAYHQSTCPSLGTPPAITTHPQNTTINSGETATLTVVAAGTAPLSYQWYRGSSGDTSDPVGTNVASFTTPALTATTSYWVRVSNSVGQANSSTATVTIDDTPTPTATIDPQVPADTNLVKNGSFSAGITQWTFYGPIDYWAPGGMLQFKHKDNSAPGGFYQRRPTALPTDAPFEVTVDLGDTGGFDKDVLVRLSESDDSNPVECTFTVGKATPLQPFIFRGLERGLDEHESHGRGDDLRRLSRRAARQPRRALPTGLEPRRDGVRHADADRRAVRHRHDPQRRLLRRRQAVGALGCGRCVGAGRYAAVQGDRDTRRLLPEPAAYAACGRAAGSDARRGQHVAA